jgi:hypothetical protein
LTEEILLATLEDAKGRLQPEMDISMDSLSEQVKELMERSQSLEAARAELEERQHQVDQLVRAANVQQVEDLMSRLSTVVEKELALRLSIQQMAGVDPEAEGEAGVQTTIDTISIRDLKHKFETKLVMEESEQEIKAWVDKLLEEELAAYKKNVLKESSDGTNGECTSVVDAVKDVQAALTRYSQDGIGLIDHAQGAEIVHSMTSPTYTPPPELSELLGNVWWRKYIPQDWELLLPHGWEKWSVSIPPYIYHSLVR